jgi:hypothetical protein
MLRGSLTCVYVYTILILKFLKESLFRTNEGVEAMERSCEQKAVWVGSQGTRSA